MTAQHYQQAHFITSAAKLTQLPEKSEIEVAFAGRSNAGKSSALNVITQQRKLAHTSKTPGRTQLINYFQVVENKYLVDLPGYGFAKVSLDIKNRWQQTLSRYLEVREPLRGLVLLMDCRHPLQPLDCDLLDWALDSELNVHILLTKCDKLSRNQAQQTLMSVKKQLKSRLENNPLLNKTDENASLEDSSNKNLIDLISVQLFSSLNRTGFDEVIAKLDEWFELPSK